VAVLGMLTFGTVSSIMSKVNFEVRGLNLKGELVPFHKPWFCVLVMFVGMSGCLFLYAGNLASSCLKRARAKRGSSDKREGYRRYMDDPSLGGEDNAYLKALIENKGEDEGCEEDDEEGPYNCSQVLGMLMIMIPSCFDLVATVLMSIGLLYVTVSIYQMMRGAELIFAAIFSVLFLGKKLYKLHYIGICLALAGITMVGIASVLAPQQNDTGTKAQQVLGIGLIILSQAIQAGQICFEEHFMKNLDFMKPTLVVGLEGLYGTLLQCLIVLPAAQKLPGSDVGGKLENTEDSLHMIFKTPDHLIAVTLVFTAFVMLFYNVLGMQVTGHLGALFRSILETTRTLLAWMVGLVMYYANVKLYGEPLGEAWTSYSYLQAAGFVVLVMGTITYGRGDEKSQEDSSDLEVDEVFYTPGESTQAVDIGVGATEPQAIATSFTPSSARRNAYYDFTAAAASVGSGGSLSRRGLRNSLQNT